MSMNVKQTLKRCLPPVLVDALKCLLGRGHSAGLPPFEYVGQGWHQATTEAPGWNEESVLATQKAKWQAFAALVSDNGPLGIAHEATTLSTSNFAAHNIVMSWAYVLALATRNKEAISLLDWGGGLGHYCLLSRALVPNVEIKYHCKEVPILCKGGREVLPDATFFDSDDECLANDYDLILASGSLQYTQDWKELTRRLASCTQGHLFITRLPVLLESPAFTMVQRAHSYGYETEYQGWAFNRQELLDHVESCGMRLVREFLSQPGPFVHSAPEQPVYRGFLFSPGSAGEG